jgi:CheY-like chemotaxis protein
VVDDDPDVLTVIERLLDSANRPNGEQRSAKHKGTSIGSVRYLDQGPVGRPGCAWYGAGTMASHVPLLAIVDDDEDVRMALMRLVASAGFVVETFASGPEFLRSIEHHEPDCVVLDLHMPEMSGFDVQGALSGHAAVPVVVITGHDTQEARARAIQLGAKSYLRKPVSDNALLEAIEMAISGHA